MVVHRFYARGGDIDPDLGVIDSMVYDKAVVSRRHVFVCDRDGHMRDRPQFPCSVCRASDSSLRYGTDHSDHDEYDFGSFPPEKRGGAMGTIGLVIMFAPAIGPTLSGLIVDTLNWRWLFYINIPFAFLSLIFAGIYLKNVTEVTKPKIDVISIILSTVGFGGMIFGFSSAGETDKDWFSTEVYGSLIAGAIALILFVWRQLKMEEPILDVRAFRFPMFSLTVVLLMIIMMTMFSTMIILPLYLQGALMLPAFVAGLALLPGGVLNGLLSPVIGRLFDRIGPRALMIPGALILVGVTWVFANVSTTMSVAVFIVLHSLLMIAVAMMMMPGQTNGLNDLPRKYYPHGTAIINTLLQVAGAIGVALFISIMTSGRARFLEQVEDPSAYGVQAEAMNAGVQSTFTVGFIFAVISLVITLFMKRTASPEKTEPHGM